jgi:hypothetical protein
MTMPPQIQDDVMKRLTEYCDRLGEDGLCAKVVWHRPAEAKEPVAVMLVGDSDADLSRVNLAQSESDVKASNTLMVNDQQFDAILAGLRLLQEKLESGEVTPDDKGIGQVLTNGGDHAGLDSSEIDDLIQVICE